MSTNALGFIMVLVNLHSLYFYSHYTTNPNSKQGSFQQSCGLLSSQEGGSYDPGARLKEMDLGQL